MQTNSSAHRRAASTLTLLLLTVLFGCGARAARAAQDDDAGHKQQPAGRKETALRGRPPGAEVIKFVRGLKLTAGQRQQFDAMISRYKSSAAAGREELMQLADLERRGGEVDEARAKELLEGQQQAFKRLRAEVLDMLTPVQRAEVERMEKASGSRREQKWQPRKSGPERSPTIKPRAVLGRQQ